MGDRREATLHKFFDLLGEAVVPTLEYVCSDMWKAYIKVIRERAGEAVHILDRYHVMSMLSKAIDKVRAEQTRDFSVAVRSPANCGNCHHSGVRRVGYPNALDAGCAWEALLWQHLNRNRLISICVGSESQISQPDKAS